MYYLGDRSNNNMFLILQCALLFVFCVNIQAQVPLGSCPDVEVVNDFDASKYVGRWYEYERYPAIFEFNAKCVTATYTAMPDGSVGVFNENLDSLNGAYKSINGSATFDGPSNVAKLSVEFPSVPAPKGTYWVLGTDYENYSVVWSCNKIIGINMAFAWILTREAVPSEKTLANVNVVLEKNKIPKQHYTKTEQKKCDRKQ